jgi:flagellar basal body-associated protein FliL
MKDKFRKNRTAILAVVLVGLLILGYKVVFVSSDEDSFAKEENVSTSARVEALLQQVENINFDTGIFTDPKLKTFQSIEIPLISLPVGRANPFN